MDLKVAVVQQTLVVFPAWLFCRFGQILYYFAYKNDHALCWPSKCTRNRCWSLSGSGMLVGEDMENCSDNNIVSFLYVLRRLWTMHEEGLCQCNCQFFILLNNLHKYCSKHRNSKGYTICPPSSETEVNKSLPLFCIGYELIQTIHFKLVFIISFTVLTFKTVWWERSKKVYSQWALLANW